MRWHQFFDGAYSVSECTRRAPRSDDRELNEHAYILPGLGDPGDRMYGTK